MSRKLLILTLCWCLSGHLALAQSGPEELLAQAKLAMFDGQWRQALDKLRELRTQSPSEPVLASSYFFEARALEKLNRPEEALRVYDVYLGRSDRDSTLVEEARASALRLAVELYRGGHQEHLERAVRSLNGPDRELSFLAALQLSRLPEDKVRRQAIPVLQRELRDSRDAEVRNQASLALLRIDPRLLESGPERELREGAKGKHLRVVISGGDGEELRLNFPLSLARLLISSLPDSARQDLLREGIQADNLVEELSKTGEILDIKSSDSRIRIWID